MGYIEPNSVIQFFKGINLDNRYLHTIYFANESAQNSWFTGKVNKTIQKHSYQRYGVGQIKVQGDATEFLDYSYLRFKNDRGVDMWFYAFINLVEYVNENTVLITYEIDVMQTWFIQKGNIRPCMIKREHVNDDTFGLNLEDEPVGSDIYDKTHITDANTLTDNNGNTVTDVFNKYNLIVTTTDDPAKADLGQVTNGVQASSIDGLFNYTLVLSGELSNSNIPDLIADLYACLGSWDKDQQKIDIVDMTTFPTAFSPYGNVASPKTFTKSFAMPTTFDLYSPKNKKLLSYPYNFLLVTSKDGSVGQYKWEYFNNVLQNNPTFKLQGSCMGGGNIIAYPMSYNGVADDVDDKVVMDDFPKNAFSYDAYQAWVASGGKTRLRNAEKINNARMFVTTTNFIKDLGVNALQMAGSGVKAYADYESGNEIGAAVNALEFGMTAAKQTKNTYAYAATMMEAKNKIAYQWKNAKYEPSVMVGTPSPSTAVGYEYLNFYFIQVHLREAEAKHIDDFFSMYGYAINRVKAPNLTGRQYWNFIQTENCVIGGDIPASSKDAIARIFDGGITFWHNGDNVGNYAVSTSNGSIDNPIV